MYYLIYLLSKNFTVFHCLHSFLKDSNLTLVVSVVIEAH